MNDMLEWHDCKADPPKKSGKYLLMYQNKHLDNIEWNSAYYSLNDKWYIDDKYKYVYWEVVYNLIKWAEVELPECCDE